MHVRAVYLTYFSQLSNGVPWIKTLMRCAYVYIISHFVQNKVTVLHLVIQKYSSGIYLASISHIYFRYISQNAHNYTANRIYLTHIFYIHMSHAAVLHCLALRYSWAYIAPISHNLQCRYSTVWSWCVPGQKHPRSVYLINRFHDLM